jgi:hypothetical protein
MPALSLYPDPQLGASVVPAGTGQYDQIGIDRVTLTEQNGNPLPSDNAIMMVHGNLWPFDDAFSGEFSRHSDAPEVAVKPEGSDWLSCLACSSWSA